MYSDLSQFNLASGKIFPKRIFDFYFVLKNRKNNFKSEFRMLNTVILENPFLVFQSLLTIIDES